jgi:histidinol-phosphate aminotransferase
VVLQTFSKSWGLAALRSGMGFASPELISILNKIKPPYNISAPTQELLLQALDQISVKQRFVEEILSEKEALHTMLTDLSFVEMIHPSDANFLLVKFENSKAVMEYLIRSKIIVRDRSNVKLCENCLRITVGTEKENKILIETLKKIQDHPELIK